MTGEKRVSPRLVYDPMLVGPMLVGPMLVGSRLGGLMLGALTMVGVVEPIDGFGVLARRCARIFRIGSRSASHDADEASGAPRATFATRRSTTLEIAVPTGGERPPQALFETFESWGSTGFGSLGSPNTRSPTMLRCICAVPPQIVSEREKKKADCSGLAG